jgi:hypothetical protein
VAVVNLVGMRSRYPVFFFRPRHRPTQRDLLSGEQLSAHMALKRKGSWQRNTRCIHTPVVRLNQRKDYHAVINSDTLTRKPSTPPWKCDAYSYIRPRPSVFQHKSAVASNGSGTGTDTVCMISTKLIRPWPDPVTTRKSRFLGMLNSFKAVDFYR